MAPPFSFVGGNYPARRSPDRYSLHPIPYTLAYFRVERKYPKRMSMKVEAAKVSF